MKRLFIVFFPCFLCVMISCREKCPDLEAAYSYMDHNQLDSAKLFLDKVDVKSLNKAGQAFYYLTKTKWDYLNYVPITKDDLIQRSANYYEDEGNDSLLAESLFYHAMILYDNGEVRQALRLLKRADVVAGKCENTPVRDKNINKKVGNLANILYLYR